MAKEIKKWTTLESRYIIQRPWLTARVDKVQLPDGRINPEHYVLEYPEWVNVIAITREGLFVMVRQYRHAMDVVLDELCAGVVEEGETPLQAAQRELLEETLRSRLRSAWIFLASTSARTGTNPARAASAKECRHS